MVSALTPAEEAKLQFNEDGTFKIMNLADIQDDAIMLSVTADYIDAAVAAEQPDLIILTGDNIAGHLTASAAKSATAIRKVMNILEPYGIPVAIVFGNHDDDGIRMFTLNESAPSEYETYLVKYQDLFADDAFAMFKHDFVAFFSNFIAVFSAFFGSLSGMFSF